MATKKSTDAKSVSNVKTQNVSNPVGRSNQSVAAIREQYKIEEERQKQYYAAASEDKVMRTLRDLTKSGGTSSSLTKTDKQTIRGYLTGNIYSNSANLINASKYLYYRSPIYSQIIDKYRSMYCFDCRFLDFNYTFQKGLDNKILKQLDDTVDFLDIISLSNNVEGAIKNMWLCDVSFNLFFHDDTGSFFYPIDSTEAVIDSIYQTKTGYCLGMALDMSKWRNQQRQALIEFLGEPVSSMWQEYQSTGVKYIHCPAEYSFVLKKDTSNIDIIIPPLLPYLSQLANLNDLIDSQATADELAFYKLIYLKLDTMGKITNDFTVDSDLAIKYFEILSNSAIPEGVSSGVVPGELKTIDFSDNVSEDVNRVENSQQQILGGMSGMGALVNANKAINNTELIKNALKAESAYALNGVLPQMTSWVNLQLALNVSNFCPTILLPVTIYTKEDYRKSLIEAMQYAYSYRLAYGTLLGFSERQTMGNLLFETQVLKLQDLMQFPLQSSYTTSNDGTGEVGAPEKDAGELSPSGERSRNS